MIIAFLIIIICIFESFTKGWGTFFLAPTMLVIAPLFLILQQAAINKLKTDRGSRIIKPLRAAQLILLPIYFIFLPGVGDTEEVLLFGFYPANYHSHIAVLSTWVAYASKIALALITLALLLRLFVYPLYGKKATIVVGTIMSLIAVIWLH